MAIVGAPTTVTAFVNTSAPLWFAVAHIAPVCARKYPLYVPGAAGAVMVKLSTNVPLVV